MVHQTQATLALRLSTGEHPMYVSGRGFVEAKDLGIGTSLVTRAGPKITVVGIEIRERAATVYNLTVEGTHTYFVGANGGGVWVHNRCPGPGHPGDLPARGGPPNRSLARDDGAGNGQIRDFNQNGNAARDFDFGHDHGSGDPHAHDWDWNQNPPRRPGRPIGPGE